MSHIISKIVFLCWDGYHTVNEFEQFLNETLLEINRKRISCDMKAFEKCITK